jgi:adenylosuccinate synthase
MKGKLTVVVGGQWGSEGKGAIVRHVANDYGVHVRVGSPNAGHTIYWSPNEDDLTKQEKHVQQIIPCGWINPDAKIVIGRGALIEIDKLKEEIAHIEKYYPDFRQRLYIDAEAGILEKKYQEAEGGKDGWFNAKIGSTGEGCGAARIARIKRDGSFKQFKDVAEDEGLRDLMVSNTPELIATMQDAGTNVLIEGTQGSGLSMLHSFYPMCTSIDTNAAGIISEVGIAPSRVTDVLMVCRTYPIRVHGNSGPMGTEITWEELFRRMGKEFEPEKTTVTKKVRRIAEWNDEIFKQSCLLNAPTEIALTFADYVDPTIEGVHGFVPFSKLPSNLRLWINEKNTILKDKLKYISTGGNTVIDLF